MTMHVDELAVSVGLVGRLIARDVPGLAGLTLRRLHSTGSSNVVFRLGDELLVRLPRQVGGAAAIDKEARYLPLMARCLPVAVPNIVAVGDPGFGYPERWSVVRWITGQCPRTPVPATAGSARFAHDLAAVIDELHQIEVPADAHADPALRWYRAGPIRAIESEIRQHLQACQEIPELKFSLGAANRFWDSAMRIPDVGSDDEPRWIHCDLLAENLLVVCLVIG